MACFGFEVHPCTEIAKMGLPFFDEGEIERRVNHAVEFLNKKEGIIVHRGGQVFETLLEREELKAQVAK